MTRGVIFDLDGTLVDSVPGIAQAMNAALESLGLQAHELSVYQTMVGEGVIALAKKAAPTLADSEPQVAALVDRYRHHYARTLNDGTRVFDGVPDVLDSLVKNGIRLGILSNKRHEFTLAVADRFLSRWPWSSVFGERDGVPRKPAPDAALAIAQAWNLPGAEIMFVGDTAIDVRTARAAGMASVGVGWGFRPRAELVAAGANHVVDAPDALAMVLGVRPVG